MNAIALPARQRRGAAMIIAITMISLVAVALVMIGRLTTLDAQRTFDERTGTQLRMMLLAGQDWLASNMDAATPGENAIPLPAALADGTLVAEVAPADFSDRRRIVVRAVLFDRSESQSIIFARTESGWSQVTAELEPMRRK